MYFAILYRYVHTGQSMGFVYARDSTTRMSSWPMVGAITSTYDKRAVGLTDTLLFLLRGGCRVMYCVYGELPK